MAQRRKNIEAGEQGTEAAAKKPRSRKARPEPAMNEATSAPEAGGGRDDGIVECGTVAKLVASDVGRPAKRASQPQPLDDPTAISPAPCPPGPAPSPAGPRVPLPGELYQRQNQWWWRVQLPGEDKAAARPLKSNGDEIPADGQEAAAQIALALWEHAVEENATRRIRLESTEKIERLKAQFLDKVRHFTELVESANAKLETEQRARAEAEAKLAHMAQATGPTTGGPLALGGHPEQVGPSPSGVVSFDRRPGTAVPPIERAEPETPTPIPDPPAVVAPVPASAQAPNPCERIPAHAGPGEQTEPVVAPAAAPPPAAVETGLCECCGASGIAMTHLTRIDSGQLLCPRCLAALRAEAARSA